MEPHEKKSIFYSRARVQLGSGIGVMVYCMDER